MKLSEYDIFSIIIMPFLKEHWESIDQVENIDKGNNVLSLEKLFIKYLEVMSEGKIHEAIVLEMIIERFEKIVSFENRLDLETPGLTKENLSKFRKHLSRSSQKIARTNNWRPAKAS